MWSITASDGKVVSVPLASIQSVVENGLVEVAARLPGFPLRPIRPRRQSGNYNEILFPTLFAG